jgi:hypothetical protein
VSALKLTLEQPIIALALDVAAQQARSDQAWLEDVCEFAPILRDARRAGIESLGLALMPSRQVLTQADFEMKLFVTQRRSTEITVRLASLGLQKRFERAVHSQLTVRCTVSLRPAPVSTADGRPAMGLRP